jgi:hypothetical protein
MTYSKNEFILTRVIRIGNLEHKEYLTHPSNISFHPDIDKAYKFKDRGMAEKVMDMVIEKWYKNSDRKPAFEITPI